MFDAIKKLLGRGVQDEGEESDGRKYTHVCGCGMWFESQDELEEHLKADHSDSGLGPRRA